jgi:small subunit ribosomal protein S11e
MALLESVVLLDVVKVITANNNRSVHLGGKHDTLENSDKKCPFTGNISIRGRIFKGVVLTTKMNRTIVIRRDYLHYIKKYNRFEKRHKTVSVHCSPAFRLKIGDVVTVGQCSPLSKTVRFNVIRKEVQRVEGNVKKAFVLF